MTYAHASIVGAMTTTLEHTAQFYIGILGHRERQRAP
jgi:hypothetical protein